MAFRTPPPEAHAWAEPEIPRGVGHLTRQHETAVEALLKAAAAANSSVDTDLTLAAIKTYRDTMRGERGVRDTVRRLARFLIVAGLPPGRVCRQLGYGRTRMNAFMREEELFAQFIEPGRKSVRKEVA